MTTYRIFAACSVITILLTACTSRARADIEYTFTNLGSLGGTYDSASGINSAGQIVGQSNHEGEPYWYQNAFHTAANTPIDPATDDLGNLGGDWAGAWAINNSGQIVGESETSTGKYHAFRTQAGPSPVLQDMGTFGGDHSMAQDINDAGRIVGSSNTPDGVLRAFSTSGNSLDYDTDNIGTLGGTQSRAFAINAGGQVTGDSKLTGDTVRHAFRTAPNSDINPATDGLGTFATAGAPIDNDFSTAEDINDPGQVVGYARTADGYTHAFCIAANSTITPADDLGTLGGTNSYAGAINSSGVVVGSSYVTSPTPTSRHAFLYRNSEMLDLNDMVDLPLGWTLAGALDINDAGQIVGYASFGGTRRAFLLTPIPEPCTLSLMALGAVAIFRKRKKGGHWGQRKRRDKPAWDKE